MLSISIQKDNTFKTQVFDFAIVKSNIKKSCLELNIFLLKIIYAPFMYKLILWLIFYFIKVIFIQQGTYCSNMPNGMPVPDEALSDYESNSDSDESYTIYGLPSSFSEYGFPPEDVIVTYKCRDNPNITAYAYFSKLINGCHINEVRRFILDGNLFENDAPTRSVIRFSRFIRLPIFTQVINRVHVPQHQVFTVSRNPFDALINSVVRGYPTHVSDIAIPSDSEESD